MNADDGARRGDRIAQHLLATLDFEREQAKKLVHADADQMREYLTANRSQSFAYEPADRVQSEDCFPRSTGPDREARTS
jgi:hypothetical protein